MNDMRTGVDGPSAFWHAEIANGDIGETEVFQSVKSAIAQILRDLLRIEKAEPGFADRGRPLRDGGDVGAPLWGIIFERLGVVEHDLGAWHPGNVTKYRRDGFARQIRHNSEPTKECRLVALKAGGG